MVSERTINYCAKLQNGIQEWFVWYRYYILLMSKEISLDSPFFLPCNFQIQRIDPPKQHEQSPFNKLEFISPELLHPRYQLRSSHPRSPWSPFVDRNINYRFNNLSSPGVFQAPIYSPERIEQVINYSDNQEEEIITPIKCEQPIQFIKQEMQQHTTGKKSEVQVQFSNKISKPKQKGLRKLSQKAFEIVQFLKNATYKQVATRLVEEMSQDDLDGENKQEQNIKRRVYDALNVLIALGVLKKDGRKIISEKDRKGRKSNDREYEQIESLKHKLAIKQQIFLSKQKKLHQVEQKAQSIKYILNRNKQQMHQKSSIIPFPFIGIMHHQGQAHIQLSQKGELTIRTLNPAQPFGDIDSLKWLKQSIRDMNSHIKQPNNFP